MCAQSRIYIYTFRKCNKIRILSTKLKHQDVFQWLHNAQLLGIISWVTYCTTSHRQNSNVSKWINKWTSETSKWNVLGPVFLPQSRQSWTLLHVFLGTFAWLSRSLCHLEVWKKANRNRIPDGVPMRDISSISDKKCIVSSTDTISQG